MRRKRETAIRTGRQAHEPKTALGNPSQAGPDLCTQDVATVRHQPRSGVAHRSARQVGGKSQQGKVQLMVDFRDDEQGDEDPEAHDHEFEDCCVICGKTWHEVNP